MRSLVTEHHSQWDQILAQVEFAYNESVNKKHWEEFISDSVWNESERSVRDKISEVE
jgi:hypothetical protein